MKKCLLYLNFFSGKVKQLYINGLLKKPLIGLFDVLDEYLVDHDNNDFRHSADYIPLRQIVAKYDYIAVCGGDGTLNNVINKIYGIDINILYLPCGTQNDFASTYKKAGLLSKPLIVDVGSINDKYFMYVCATGTLCNISYLTDMRTKQRFKKIAYAFTALRQFKAHSIAATIHCNGQDYTGQYALIMVAKANFVAGHKYTNANFVHDDGKAHLVLIDTPKGLFKGFKLFCRYFKVFVLALKEGKTSKHIRCVQCNEVDINLDNNTEFCIDGDMYKPPSLANKIKIFDKRINIEIIPIVSI